MGIFLSKPKRKKRQRSARRKLKPGWTNCRACGEAREGEGLCSKCKKNPLRKLGARLSCPVCRRQVTVTEIVGHWEVCRKLAPAPGTSSELRAMIEAYGAMRRLSAPRGYSGSVRFVQGGSPGLGRRR